MSLGISRAFPEVYMAFRGSQVRFRASQKKKKKLQGYLEDSAQVYFKGSQGVPIRLRGVSWGHREFQEVSGSFRGFSEAFQMISRASKGFPEGFRGIPPGVYQRTSRSVSAANLKVSEAFQEISYPFRELAGGL